VTESPLVIENVKEPSDSDTEVVTAPLLVTRLTGTPANGQLFSLTRLGSNTTDPKIDTVVLSVTEMDEEPS